MCIGIKKFLDRFLACTQRCFGRVVSCVSGVTNCYRTTQKKEEESLAAAEQTDGSPAAGTTKKIRVSPKEARERLPKDITWEKATLTVTQSIKDGMEQYDRMHTEEEHELTLNMPNIVAIASEVRHNVVTA